MENQTFNFDVLSMKVKHPDGGIFELKINPTPSMPITIDNSRLYELISDLKGYREELLMSGDLAIAYAIDKMIVKYKEKS
jgi:hypothetical protein